VPVRITVPSGMERSIEYALEADGTPRPPVLAVKLQELFGLAETPRIAHGRVPLLLHLLSPAGRPLQVTADLRSFWENTWPEVRRACGAHFRTCSAWRRPRASPTAGSPCCCTCCRRPGARCRSPPPCAVSGSTPGPKCAGR